MKDAHGGHDPRSQLACRVTHPGRVAGKAGLVCCHFQVCMYVCMYYQTVALVHTRAKLVHGPRGRVFQVAKLQLERNSWFGSFSTAQKLLV